MDPGNSYGIWTIGSVLASGAVFTYVLA